MLDEVIQATPMDDEVEEEWERMTDDEFRNISAGKPSNYMWQVTVALAEFLREEPLESEMRREMDRALRAVPGVTEVTEDDREIWDVDGSPSGQALAVAAAAVVDTIATRAHELLGF